MSVRHYILATAGHVDHGKSALVRALTGTDPDRLPEEKARAITIDLGFAHLGIETTVAGQRLSLSIGLVDVPGHEDFVKNMVAGVSAVDGALFVVAADDGWMPQSEEHLQILHYLGVERAVVALTKADLVAGHETERIAAVHARLEHSPFAHAPIVPTSVVTGQGLDTLTAALARELSAAPAPPDYGKPRLPIDRVFTLKGIGTVITGTLTGGTLRRGQPVALEPGSRPTRIRTLQSHHAELEEVGPGTRVAVNLPDVAPRSASNPGGVARGDVLTLPDLGGASRVVDVQLERSPRPAPGRTSAARPIEDGLLVRVHHGSANTAARLWLGGVKTLEAGQRALAELRLEHPVFLFAGDRFIVRDWSEQTTLAGGVVLDPDADRRRWRGEGQRRFLEERSRAAHDAATWVATQVARDGAVLGAALARKARVSEAQTASAIDRLRTAGRVEVRGEWVVEREWWDRLCADAAGAIEAEHRARPDLPGLALRDLRGVLGARVASPGLFNSLVEVLATRGYAQTGTRLHRASHQPALPPHLEAAGHRLRTVLSARRLDPPSRKELAADALTQQALRFLVQAGEVIEVTPEVVLSAEAHRHALATIRSILTERTRATVSELRQALGTSRRVLVPLLERLDREGVTRRDGDYRTLGRRG